MLILPTSLYMLVSSGFLFFLQQWSTRPQSSCLLDSLGKLSLAQISTPRCLLFPGIIDLNNPTSPTCPSPIKPAPTHSSMQALWQKALLTLECYLTPLSHISQETPLALISKPRKHTITNSTTNCSSKSAPSLLLLITAFWVLPTKKTVLPLFSPQDTDFSTQKLDFSAQMPQLHISQHIHPCLQVCKALCKPTVHFLISSLQCTLPFSVSTILTSSPHFNTIRHVLALRPLLQLSPV